MGWMVLESCDRELIEACRRGERDAFRTLFETYQDKIYSIALRFSGNEALAMDIAQETFLAAWTQARSFRGQGSVRAWLFSIAWRKAKGSQRGWFRAARRGHGLA